jgi:hypothetical protein
LNITIFALAAMALQVDQARVDAAIEKGIQYLKTAPSPPFDWGKIKDSDELILWTLVHARVPETEVRFKALLDRMIGAKLERTYEVALQALILEEVDRVKYQERIFACAQFLVDNQCRNGQWGYGEPTVFSEGVPTGAIRRDVTTLQKVDAAGLRVKPKVVRRLAVKRTRQGPAEGDNSNAQYAALGLRACHEAGIAVPKETLLLAAKSWRDTQHAPGRDPAAGQGWCYGDRDSHPAYGGMTAGAVGSLVIYDHLLGKDPKKDAAVKSGLDWLARNFTVTEHPGPPEHKRATTRMHHYYYLYALERTGMLCGVEDFGGRAWYPEGAKIILAAQKPDGSWDTSQESTPTWDTCFAILFLRRATRPLDDVPSIDRYLKPGDK